MGCRGSPTFGSPLCFTPTPTQRAPLATKVPIVLHAACASCSDVSELFSVVCCLLSTHAGKAADESPKKSTAATSSAGEPSSASATGAAGGAGGGAGAGSAARGKRGGKQRQGRKGSAGKQSHTFPAKIAPPVLKGRRIGLFCTRSPHRPNPIGLTLVRVDGVDARRGVIQISGLDLVDGTPVLDIKPYVPGNITMKGVCATPRHATRERLTQLGLQRMTRCPRRCALTGSPPTGTFACQSSLHQQWRTSCVTVLPTRAFTMPRAQLAARRHCNGQWRRCVCDA